MDYDRLLTLRTEPANSGGTPVTDPPESGRRTLVAVVEDHEILRHGLVACLIREPGIEVTVPSGDEPLAEGVDIAVVSSQAASRERFPCPIVVCSDGPDGPRNVAEGNNVVGLVHRETITVPQLHATIAAAAAGLRVLPTVVSTKHNEELDPRSLRLLELIAEGHNTREIADDMSYSQQTIKKLITTVEGRLEARSRAQMVAVAIRRGLI